MKNHAYLLAAACLCTSAGMFVYSVGAAEPAHTNNANSQMGWDATDTGNLSAPNFPGGITEKQMNDKDGIEKAFGSVTNSAFTKRGFKDVLDVLCDQDRTRLKDEKPASKDQSSDTLSQRVDELNQAWKAKYNHAFDIKYDQAYDNFLTFRTGEISDPNQLVGKWPLPVTSMDVNRGGEASAQDIQSTEKHAFGGDVNLEKGRNVAIAEYPGQNGMPNLTLSMVHEAGGWKFDIPNDITREQVHQALLNHLSRLYDRKDQWPSDINAGYREATYCVISALYNLQNGVNQAEINGNNAPTANNR